MKIPLGASPDLVECRELATLGTLLQHMRARSWSL